MNPFQVVSSRTVYENSWIEVVENQILNPKGHPGIYGVVHFKNRAVGVIPYSEGKIWLVGQYRFPLKQYSWEIPEGGSPADEDFLETARRELQEETGMTADSYQQILKMHLSNSVSDELAIVFLARGLHFGTSNPEETEQLEIKAVSLQEAYEMVNSGSITDSMSVAGILKLVLMEREGNLSDHAL